MLYIYPCFDIFSTLTPTWLEWLYLNISEPRHLEFPPSLETMEFYAPRLGYIPRPINSFRSPGIFRAFDIATHQMRILNLDTSFAKSSVDVSQDLLVLISAQCALLLYVDFVGRANDSALSE